MNAVATPRLVALALACLALPARADTLVSNVTGVTLDARGQVERFTGIVIGDDGRVARVLRDGEKPAQRPAYAVDGKGRVMLPGLIDAHAHIMSTGFGLLTLDLSDTISLADAQARIAAYAKAHPDRAWIIGRGWNQESWKLGRFPTAAELDAAVPDRPVWLERIDGHADWANSAAIAAAKVTALTKDPPGGRIERLAGGKPAGVFVDTATKIVEQVVPPPRPEDRDLAFAAAQHEFLAHGFTTVTDMAASIEDWQTFRRAGDGGRLQARVFVYADGVEAMALIGGPGPTPWLYDDRLKMNGLKLFLDGALGSRGAALKAPYADDPRNSGTLRLTATQLKNLMSRAALDHFQVAVHAIGDRANAMMLDAIDELSQTYAGDRRWRVEHAQIVDPADLPRFGTHGIIASMQPQHEASDRVMAEARLGPSRLAGAYAWASMLKAGARLAFGDDSPVEPPRPFLGLAIAITRQGADGQPFGGWQPQEVLTREAALAAYTTGGAYAGFAEDRLGRIAPGMRADFVLVDQDPMLASPADLRATRVLETWVGGEKVYDARDDGAPPPAKPL